MEEKIHQDEPVETPEGSPTIQPSFVHHKKQTVTGLIKEMWPAYLIEIIVIILGISITLALEEWRDNSRENHLEQIYLKNIQTDVETDLKTLELSITATQSLLQKGNDLLDIARASEMKSIAPNQVYEDIRAILSRPNFISGDATFTELKSSGNLHLIRNIQLKNLLFAYYNETQQIKEVQIAEQQTTIILAGAYFLKQVPLDKYNIRNGISHSEQELQSLVTNIEFNNNVLLRVTNREELLRIYQNTDSLAKQLVNELAREAGN
jgi:hypothetical protein